MRIWKNYINRQKYSECQIITALNAYYYLTGEVYCKQDSQEYDDLIYLCGARSGSAIGVEKNVHKKLGLKIIGYSNFLGTYWTDEWHRLATLEKWKKGEHLPKKLNLPKKISRKIRLPVEINTWHKRTGFHSVLIVDHCLKTKCFRITNFRHVTTAEGWMFTEDLYQFIDDCNKGWVFRLFGLKKKKCNSAEN